MFGKNRVVQQDLSGGYTLQVVKGSPFLTIQGEGPFAGQPAIFLRLHGCNLRCTFCDTDFDRPEDSRIHVEVLFELIKNLAHTSPGCKLVVITGGEPVLQQLGFLVELLWKENFIIQVETNGTLWQECLSKTHVVVAPKTPKIHPRIEALAIAYKYTISGDDAYSSEDGLPVSSTQPMASEEEMKTSLPLARPKYRVLDPQPYPEVYLYPRDQQDPTKNAANATLTAMRALRFGYKAGVQLHKVMNVQ